MATLPTNRTTANTPAEHVLDHNTIHSLWNIATTKGDLITVTGAQTYVRLPIGSDGQTLVADSAQSSGMKWASVAALGGVTRLQGTTPATAPLFYVNVKDYGAVGDGVTDDSSAINAALVASPIGSLVVLPADSSETYLINGPIIVPPFKGLMGQHGNRTDNIQTTAVIKIGAAFAGDTGAIRLKDQEEGGYATPNDGVRLYNLTLDYSSAPTATIDGILATGKVHGVIIDNVCVQGAIGGNKPRRGINCQNYTRIDTSVVHPFSWNIWNCLMFQTSDIGYSLQNGQTDCTLFNNESLGCGGSGFVLTACANTQVIGCRAEFCSNGFLLTGSWGTGTGSGGAIFTGCSTDRNTSNGVLINSTGNANHIFNGTMCRRDGRNGNAGGGSFAGFAISSAATPVVINGLTVYPGVDDDGTGANSPQFGFSCTNSSNVIISNSYLHADTTAFNDGGGNTNLRRGLGVLTATGTTAAPTRSTSSPWNNEGTGTIANQTADQAALIITNSAGNTGLALIDVTGSASTSRLLSSLVSGDGQRRYNLRVDGLMEWGDGTAARDVQLSRPAADVLAVGVNDTIRTGVGSTGSRPSASAVGSGSQWYDSTLKTPIWSDGTNWNNAAGSTTSFFSIDGAGTGAVAAAHSGDTVTASSTQAIAIGKFASANTGAEAIAIGGGVSAQAAPQSTAQGSIAIGASDGAAVNGSRASATSSIAIGSGDSATAGALASGAASLAIGIGSTATQAQAIAIGSFALSQTAGNGIAIGAGVDATRSANATSNGAIAIGSNDTAAVNGSRASGAYSVAIGGGTTAQAGAAASASRSVAIGSGSVASQNDALALGGFAASTTGTQTLAIGSGVSAATAAAATAQGAIAIGSSSVGANGAKASGANAVAIGSGDGTATGASAAGTSAISIGKSAGAAGTNGVAIGVSSSASQSGNIAIGGSAQATTSTQAIAIGGGTNSTAAPQATAQGAIAIGASNAAGVAGSRSSGTNSIAIGSGDGTNAGASATGGDTIAIGRLSSATATFGIALGTGASATQAQAVAIGTLTASTTATNSISIGSGATAAQAASATGLDSIAVGSNDTAATNGARSSGAQSIAIGGGTSGAAGASATAAQAIAIGRATTAAFATSVAIGAGAASTKTNQIVLGTSAEEVRVPGYINGTGEVDAITWMGGF